MDILNKKVMILGGWGLVGSAVARKFVQANPKEIILTSLLRSEAENVCKELNKEYKRKNLFIPAWGNIFIREEFKDVKRDVYLNDIGMRSKVISDLVCELDEKILKSAALYKLIGKFRPDIIIDCINTATGIAYQNLYKTSYDILKITRSNSRDFDKLKDASEKMICASYIPQLIRHIQILHNSMRAFKTKYYFKVGTSGTGGMGLNIPFTHSEEKPSRVLLSKSSVAGAQTLLLFLMARTPGGPLIKEIKPTASIAWKKISYGEIKRNNKPIPVYDIPLDKSESLTGMLKPKDESSFRKKGTLKTVYIDTGENGIFSRGEFEAITTNGQMEFVTPEEIAENLYREMIGGNTGNDVITALDSSAMEPSYRAGFLQHSAVDKIVELEIKKKTHSVAFEMLGPPRLSKLLFEAHLIRLAYKNFNNFIKDSSSSCTKKISGILSKNSALRNEIVSIGIPILMSDGKKVLRGPDMKIPSLSKGESIKLTRVNIEKWTHDCWIDLRESNWKEWKKRFVSIIKNTDDNFDPLFSSREIFHRNYWHNFDEINIGKIAGWIFINEEQGLRMKG